MTHDNRAPRQPAHHQAAGQGPALSNAADDQAPGDRADLGPAPDGRPATTPVAAGRTPAAQQPAAEQPAAEPPAARPPGAQPPGAWPANERLADEPPAGREAAGEQRTSKQSAHAEPAGAQTEEEQAEEEQAEEEQAAAERAADEQAEDGPAAGRQVRVSSPAGVLAVVPHLLGFHPSRSVVVIGLSGASDQVAMAFRYDLPDPPDAELAADIAAHAAEVLSRQEVPAAIVIGYGPADLVIPVAGQVVGALVHAGVQLREILRAEGGRYWSATCKDPACCPAEGHSYDPCSHPAAAMLDAAGLSPQPDRAALARTLEPEPGMTRAIRQATSRALRRVDKVLAQAEMDGDAPAAVLAEVGRAAVCQAIHRYRDGGRITDRTMLAYLAVSVTDLRVRDDAWARMDLEHCRAHLLLWTDVVKGAAPEFVPAAASLLAFTAWQCGEGALANVAVDRALAADPAYSMALLLAQAVQSGLPPSSARLTMTPEEVAASYADAG
jgi:hypothetical protein